MILLQPWWLLLAVVCALAYLLFNRNSRDDWSRVINKDVLGYLRPAAGYSTWRYPGYLVAALAAVALSGPSTPVQDSQSFKHSQGWIVIADISRSMTHSDIAPSRLSAMRDTLLEIANSATAISISLIIYAGDAFVVAPPSYDTVSFHENASLLNYGLIPLDGSNPGRALSLAYSIIERSQLINARLLILSDSGGFNNKTDAAIARLAALGHRSDIILFGSENTTSAAEFNIKTAQSMAKSGGGKLLFADPLGRVDLAPLSLKKLTLDPSLLTQTGLSTLSWANQSHWLLLLAVPLLLLLFHREQR